MHRHPAIGARRPTDALVQHTQWFSPVDVHPLAMLRYIFHVALLISFLVMLLMGRVPSFTFPLSVSFRYLFSLYILPILHVLPTSLEIDLNSLLASSSLCSTTFPARLNGDTVENSLFLVSSSLPRLQF